MKLHLNKPKKLEPGDTICIIAPSAGIAHIFPHRVENAVAMLRKLGYKVVFGKHSLEMSNYVSATAEKRAQDIHDAFIDKDIKMIISMIGGDHSNQILKYLDFEIIKNNPKIFIGYSDISVLHYAFMKKSNLQTFYGPCLMCQFGEYPETLPYTLDYFNKAVKSLEPIGDVISSKNWTAETLDWGMKKDLERPRKLIQSEGYEWLKQGSASGPILGGCVPSINHLSGTEYWIDPADNIFFIDIPEGHEFDKGLPIHELDAYLSDLDNMGVFGKITGLIIGRPYSYSADEYSKLKEIILYYTQKYNYPILLNANIGHCDPIITLPFGVNVRIDSKRNEFFINEPSVI